MKDKCTNDVMKQPPKGWERTVTWVTEDEKMLVPEKQWLQPYQQFLTGENSSGLFYAASNKPVTEKRGENNITWLEYLCRE